jgi:AcrR family transcriptional regulator
MIASEKAAPGRPRTPRSDGLRSRQAILEEAARLATVEGLEGLSIGRLADAVGMSKSGLFAHFGSKEELQLATIETASALFSALIIEPARSAPDGLERIRRLTGGFLDHLEAGVYPGGCFFASVAAELDTHPGPVRDLAIDVIDSWMGMLVETVREAQGDGAIDSREEPEQLAFELDAFLLLANAQYVARRSPTPLVRARNAIATRLSAARS